MKTPHRLLSLGLGAILAACNAELDGRAENGTGGTNGSDGQNGANGGPGGPDAGPSADGGPGQPVVPQAAPVRFKGGARLRTDWARGLGLDVNDVCRELGQYDCATEVHNIVLGGVEPYVLNINSPLPEAPVTAPLAVERVALAACSATVERDFREPESAVVFRPPGDGAWTAGARRGAHERLIEGLLKRRANDEELDRLEQLWTQSADPTEWATSSCFVVASSLESLFY